MHLKDHWEGIYTEKSDLEVSWFQKTPLTSIKLIDELEINLDDPIIDIGGGNSKLAAYLVENGYLDVSLLDISGVCIQKMKEKYPNVADKIKWIESDVNTFDDGRKYKVWHDRAVFHFFSSNGKSRSTKRV